GGSLAALVQLRDDYSNGLQAQLDEVARGLISAFSETDPNPPGNTAPGLFIWDTPPTMPPAGTRTVGLAGLISLNPLADPTQPGGDAQRLRDGIAFNANPDNYGNFNDLLIGFTNAMDAHAEFISVDGTTVTMSLMTY